MRPPSIAATAADVDDGAVGSARLWDAAGRIGCGCGFFPLAVFLAGCLGVACALLPATLGAADVDAATVSVANGMPMVMVESRPKSLACTRVAVRAARADSGGTVISKLSSCCWSNWYSARRRMRRTVCW